jgi:YbbR domain-containing protein
MMKPIEAIKGFFSQDLAWKIFSLVIAILLWFVVMNTLNPTEVKSFTTNLTFVDESVLNDNNIIITNRAELEQTKVTIKVKGTRPALDELSKPKNKAEIKAYVELKQLNNINMENAPQEFSLSITPKLPDNIFLYSYDITSCTPKYVDAQVDRLKSETMRLKLNVTGSGKSGYNVSDPVCDVDTVTVTGPQSMFDKVASVTVSVDITDKTSNVDASVAPVVCDADGNPLTLFTVDPSIVDVSVSINKQWQMPVKEPEVIGELNDNLVLKSIEYTPKSVEVEGSLDDINKVQSIELPAVNLSAIENSQTFTYDIRPSFKGTNLQLKDGQPTEVQVVVTVNAKASRDITLTQKDFTITGLAADLTSEIEDVNVTLYGEEEYISSITAAQLAPKLDLKDQTEGWHSLPVEITLSDNVQMRTKPSATVVITNKNTAIEPATEITTKQAEQQTPVDEPKDDKSDEDNEAATQAEN